MKKFSHKKGVTIALVALAAVAIGTVGFSAWIIGATETNDTISVSVTVGEVEDKRLTFEAEVDSSNNTICFDSPSSSTGTSGTITGVGEEDLNFGFTLTITATDTSVDFEEDIEDYLSQIEVAFDTTGLLTEVITSNYIQAPFENYGSSSSRNVWFTGSELASNDENSDSEMFDDVNNTDIAKWTYDVTYNGNVITIDGTFSFSWGSVFNYQNPVYGSEVDALKTFAEQAPSSGTLGITFYCIPVTD